MQAGVGEAEIYIPMFILIIYWVISEFVNSFSTLFLRQGYLAEPGVCWISRSRELPRSSSVSHCTSCRHTLPHMDFKCLRGSKFRTSHLVSKCLIPCSTSIAHTASLCLMHIYLLSSSFRTYQGTGIGLHSWFNSQLFSDCIWCPVGIRGIILLKKKYSFFKICNRNPILLTSLSA